MHGKERPTAEAPATNPYMTETRYMAELAFQITWERRVYKRNGLETIA